MNQRSFFGDDTDDLQLPAPVEGVEDTSKDAAASVKPAQGADARMVLDLIAASGDEGMTCDEVEVVTGRSHQTISARVYDLKQAGYIGRHIAPDGAFIRRPTRSGRGAHVWYAEDRT